MLPGQGSRDFTGPSCEAEQSHWRWPCSVDLVAHILLNGIAIACRFECEQVLPNEVLLPQEAGGRRTRVRGILCQVLCGELRAERPRSNFRKAFLTHSGKSLRVSESVIQR